MTESWGSGATVGLVLVAALIVAGGVWFGYRGDDTAGSGGDVLTAVTTTPPGTAVPAQPAETMLVVTLPTTTSTTTTTVAATTTISTSTSTTTTEVPAPYRTAAEQIDYYTSGPERERVIADLTSLTPYVVSVDELAARHEIMGPTIIEYDDDGRLSGLRSTPAGIVVSMTSDFSGQEAVAEEAWIVTKYFAPLWAPSEPIRRDIDRSGHADQLDIFVGYSLEVNIGRHSYQTTGPELAAIADVRLGFAEWERRATLANSDS